MSDYKVVWYNGDDVVCALTVKRGKMRVGQQEALAIQIARTAQPLEPHDGYEVTRYTGGMRYVVDCSVNRIPF